MAHRDAFSTDEWAEVALAPMLASFAVTAADPGSLVGVFQESAATARAMAEARKREGSLESEVVATYESSDGRGAARDAIRSMTKGKSPADATAEAVARLGRAAATVADRAPGEVAAFKAWLRDLAHAVAEAGTEGGFLGFGGEKVSDAERKTLADIDAALGLAG